jgi:phospholipid/cholesterol/gamma-HCH transport system substrate-binding protein
MQSNKGRYAIVGFVLLLALVILVFGMTFLNETNTSQKFTYYNVEFKQVSTLSMGDPVKVNGVKVGKVVDISLKGRKVNVVLKVQKEIKIPSNSSIKVQNIGLLGERQIGILMGDGSTYISPQDVLEGGFDAGISEAMGLAGEVFDSTRALLATVTKVVNNTIAQPDFQHRFNTILANAETLELRLDTILRKTDPLLQTSLKNLKKASMRVNELLENTAVPIDSLLLKTNIAADHANVLLSRADSLSRQIVALTAKLESSENTIGALLNDETFYQDLSRTIRSADTLFNVIVKDGLDVNVDIF